MNKYSSYFLRFYFFIWSAGILFIFTRGDFLKSHDDPKKLILYSCLFLLTIFGQVFLYLKTRSLEIFKINKFGLFILVFFLFYFINLILNRTPYEGWVQFSELILLSLGIYFLSRFDADLIGKIMKDIILLSPLIFAFSLYYSYPTKVLIKPIGHVSYFADFFLFILPWIFYFFIQSDNKIKKLLYALVFIIGVLALFMSSRRAPVLGLIASSSFVFIFLVKKIYFKKFITYGAGLITILVGLFLSLNYGSIRYMQDQKPLSERMADVTKGYDNSWEYKILVRKFKKGEIKEIPQKTFLEKFFKSNKSRLTMFYISSTSFSEFSKWMIGNGYGSFKYLYPYFYENSDLKYVQFSLFNDRPSWLMHPHSFFIFHLFEGGIIGLSFILVIFLIIFIQGIKFYNRFFNPSSRSHYHLMMLSLSSLIGLIVALNLDTGSTNGVIRYAFLLNLGIIFSLFRSENFFSKIIWFRKKSIYLTLLILFNLFLVISGYAASSNYYKSYIIAQGYKEIRRDKHMTRDDEVARLGPHNFDEYYFLGFSKYIKGDYRLARLYLESAYVRYPFIPQIHMQLAKTYLKQGKMNLFKAIVDRSLLIYPENKKMLRLKQRYKKYFN